MAAKTLRAIRRHSIAVDRWYDAKRLGLSHRLPALVAEVRRTYAVAERMRNLYRAIGGAS